MNLEQLIKEQLQEFIKEEIQDLISKSVKEHLKRDRDFIINLKEAVKELSLETGAVRSIIERGIEKQAEEIINKKFKIALIK